MSVLLTREIGAEGPEMTFRISGVVVAREIRILGWGSDVGSSQSSLLVMRVDIRDVYIKGLGRYARPRRAR